MAFKWTVYHISVFLLTFFGYALFHATRKTFSNVKQSMSDDWTPMFMNPNDTSNVTYPDKLWNSHQLFKSPADAEFFMGILDTVFMVAYAVGLFISGFVGDRLNMRKVLTFGMCSSAISAFMFGSLSQWLHIYSIPYYAILWGLTGLLQSTGWPSMVAVMANWFGKSSRGLILGIWSACASVGNIIGALMVANVVDYGYEYAFLLPTGTLFCWGILTFLALVPDPKEVGMPRADEDGHHADVTDSATADDTQPLLSHGDSDPNISELIQDGRSLQSEDGSHIVIKGRSDEALGFCKALMLPGVIPYSFCYACLKFVNYAFFFWLPFYLGNKFGWSNAVADEISIWYDVGGIIAGIIGGMISDAMGMRAPVTIGMLLLALPALFCYNLSPNNEVVNSVLLCVAGLFIGGPSNLISACISADLGKQDVLQNNKQALATVTGIVDGTGSVGAAIGQILIPPIQNKLGWQYVFYFFIVMTFLALLCILPVLWNELKNTACCRRCTSGGNTSRGNIVNTSGGAEEDEAGDE